MRIPSERQVDWERCHHDRQNKRVPARSIAFTNAQTFHEVPTQMPHTIKEMIPERPKRNDHHNQAQPWGHQIVNELKISWRSCGGQEPPDNQDASDGHTHSGDPVDNGHHHSDVIAINRQMRRERSIWMSVFSHFGPFAILVLACAEFALLWVHCFLR